ncbi:unnamed protein product [Ilex paraguariensis]|uniref:Uncharacterized protein n=1 Tax=Ilex paraguariensis TaxID=185542 RepID=A0ABC8TU79_9AQUA
MRYRRPCPREPIRRSEDGRTKQIGMSMVEKPEPERLDSGKHIRCSKRLSFRLSLYPLGMSGLGTEEIEHNAQKEAKR